MKKRNKHMRLIVAAGLILMTALTLSSCGKASDNNKTPETAINQPSPDFTPGDGFTPEGLSVDEGTLIVDQGTLIADSIRADITGDGSADDIILTGLKQEDVNPYMNNISLAVKDGKTGKYTQASIGQDNVGYEPTLVIGSFVGADSKEFLVSVATGGSGGIMVYSLLNFIDDTINPVISQELLNQGLQLETTCLDGFKLTIKDKSTGYTTDIDLSKMKNDYVAMGIYDKSGNLLQDPMILVDGYSLMQAEDTNGDGLLELRGVQSISVGAHANQVARAESVWSVKDGTLKLLEEKVAPIN